MTFANVVSVIALFVALGGSSYAALTVTGKNVKNSSLTGKDIKNSSLTTSDVKNRSLLAADFKSGQLPAGPQGAQGAQGPKGDKGDKGDQGATGDAGSAVAYAHIAADGTLDPARSKNVRASSKFTTGLYCVDFTVTPKNVVATIDAFSGQGQIVQHTDPDSSGQCFTASGVYNVQVRTSDSAGTSSDRAFDIAVN